MDGNTSSHRSLQGLHGLVLGLANDHSIAWGCLQQAREQGAELIASCLNEKARPHVQSLTKKLGIDLIDCDVEQPGALEALLRYAREKFSTLDFVVHSIAWAPAADLNGRVVDSSREGFCRAMTISCHSLAELGKLCEPLMPNGGSLIAMSYLGAEKAVPHYGLMGPVKAALESLVRYMALELGPSGIRVNAVSPGPIRTRAASGISGFDEILDCAQHQSPLRRLVTLEEIAQLTLFLSSPAASGITGETLFVDAGCHVMA